MFGLESIACSLSLCAPLMRKLNAKEEKFEDN